MLNILLQIYFLKNNLWVQATNFKRYKDFTQLFC